MRVPCGASFEFSVRSLAAYTVRRQRPQFHEPVQAVEARRVLIPAGTECGGEVAEARAVYLLDPGAQPGEGLGALVAGELPPAGRWRWLIGAIRTVFLIAADRCEVGETGHEGCDWGSAGRRWRRIRGRGGT